MPIEYLELYTTADRRFVFAATRCGIIVRLPLANREIPGGTSSISPRINQCPGPDGTCKNITMILLPSSKPGDPHACYPSYTAFDARNHRLFLSIGNNALAARYQPESLGAIYCVDMTTFVGPDDLLKRRTSIKSVMVLAPDQNKRRMLGLALDLAKDLMYCCSSPIETSEDDDYVVTCWSIAEHEVTDVDKKPILEKSLLASKSGLAAAEHCSLSHPQEQLVSRAFWRVLAVMDPVRREIRLFSLDPQGNPTGPCCWIDLAFRPLYVGFDFFNNIYVSFERLTGLTLYRPNLTFLPDSLMIPIKQSFIDESSVHLASIQNASIVSSSPSLENSRYLCIVASNRKYMTSPMIPIADYVAFMHKWKFEAPFANCHEHVTTVSQLNDLRSQVREMYGYAGKMKIVDDE